MAAYTLFPRFIGILFLLLAFQSQAANNTINIDRQGLALKGYDPVSYFVSNGPRMGEARFQHHWDGATWYFASQDNLDRFIDNPQQYAPQFGGFCAFALSKGQLADSDPQAWSIINDKLYLNYNKQVRSMWLPQASTLIPEAERRWPGIRR